MRCVDTGNALTLHPITACDDEALGIQRHTAFDCRWAKRGRAVRGSDSMEPCLNLQMLFWTQEYYASDS